MEIDEQVVVACQRKDARAQKKLYEALAPRMLGLCTRYTHSHDEAQDLLHDGFIKVFENIGSLQNTHAVEAWVKQIMVRLCINYVMRRREVEYRDFSLMDDDPHMADEQDIPFETQHTAQQIVRALQQLPDRYQLVFNLREVEELEYADIATRLNLTEATVRSINSRAKQMIRNRLKVES